MSYFGISQKAIFNAINHLKSKNVFCIFVLFFAQFIILKKFLGNILQLKGGFLLNSPFSDFLMMVLLRGRCSPRRSAEWRRLGGDVCVSVIWGRQAAVSLLFARRRSLTLLHFPNTHCCGARPASDEAAALPLLLPFPSSCCLVFWAVARRAVRQPTYRRPFARHATAAPLPHSPQCPWACLAAVAALICSTHCCWHNQTIINIQSNSRT